MKSVVRYRCVQHPEPVAVHRLLQRYALRAANMWNDGKELHTAVEDKHEGRGGDPSWAKQDHGADTAGGFEQLLGNYMPSDEASRTADQRVLITFDARIANADDMLPAEVHLCKTSRYCRAELPSREMVYSLSYTRSLSRTSHCAMVSYQAAEEGEADLVYAAEVLYFNLVEAGEDATAVDREGRPAALRLAVCNLTP